MQMDMKNKKGYTLMELIIVIFLLSFLFTPIYLGARNILDDLNLKRASSQLVSDLREIRTRAMAGESKSVVLGLNKEFYLIRKNTKIEKRIYYPKNISMDYTGSSEINFDIDGVLSTGTSLTIVLVNKNKKRNEITILKPTGRVKLYDKK